MTLLELLYLAIALQVITIAGLFAQQAQTRHLQGITDRCLKNNSDMLESNKNILGMVTRSNDQNEKLLEAHRHMERQLQLYIDIYGPLTEK